MVFVLSDSHYTCGHGLDPQYGECQECRDEDHVRYVDQLVKQAGTLARDGEQGVSSLRRAIAELCSNQVYDIELAEGPGGDALHELDAALRHLRNVRRIVDARVRQMKDDQVQAAGAPS
jgi:hypothetical protein